MTPKFEARKLQAATIIDNLKKRNMNGHYFDTAAECLTYLQELMPKDSIIAWGGSMTFEDTGIKAALMQGEYQIIDRDLAKTPLEKRVCFSKTVMSDYYFMSSNAITMDGELINVDGNGNRLACLMQGPAHVILLVGMNKVVSDETEGLKRIRDIAGSANAVRLHRNTPCATTGKCGDCQSPDCICSHIVVTRHSGMADRIHVCLINEDLGY